MVNIPFGVFNNIEEASVFIKKSKLPIVIKADGLAAGKGVSICNSEQEALKNTKDILSGKFMAGDTIVASCKDDKITFHKK